MKKYIILSLLYSFSCNAFDRIGSKSITFTASPVIRVYSNNAPTIPADFFEDGIDHIANNKMKYIGAACGLSYILITSRMLRIKRMMNNPQKWNNLFEKTSLADLSNLSQEELHAKLEDAIISRYDIPQLMTVLGITQFFKDTESEVHLLKQFNILGSLLCKFKINLPFLITSHDVNRAQSKIKRLVYFRTILANKFETEKTLKRYSLISNYYKKLRRWTLRTLRRNKSESPKIQ